MIFSYTVMGFFWGLLAAQLFKFLPKKWLCDYGEAPCEKHSKENRKLKASGNLLISIICAAACFCFMYFLPAESSLSVLSFLQTVPVLLLIALSDIKYHIIPNELLLIAAVFGAPLAFKNGYMQPLWGVLLGAGLLFAVFFIGSKLLKKEAMGFGDVLLSALCGYLCGAAGYIIVLFAAVISAAIIFTLLLLVKKADKDTPQPFGPFLVSGILLALCFWPFWQQILQRYFYF